MDEHEKARQWRLAHNLTPDQLGELIGYSKESIYWFEKGLTPDRKHSNSRFKQKDRNIRPWVWRRYQMACAGADMELKTGKAFKWI